MNSWTYRRAVNSGLPLSGDLGGLSAAVMTAVYPGGLPSSGVDVDEDGVALLETVPASAATVRRLTILQNGGYEAGGTPMYAWLMSPAVPSGGLVVYYHGHGTGPWEDHYAYVAEAVLAEGHHCLVLCLPGFGNPDPTQIVVDGTTHSISQHYVSEMFDSIVPDPFRLFTDHAFRAINHALTTLGLAHVTGLITFSGGGFCGAVMQTLDARIHNRYSIAGFWPLSFGGQQIQGRGDWEYLFCPRLRAACEQEYFVGDILEWTSVLGSRHAVNVFLTNDVQYSKGRHWMVSDWIDEAQARLYGVANGGLECWVDNEATAHDVTSWALTQILADISSRT